MLNLGSTTPRDARVSQVQLHASDRHESVTTLELRQSPSPQGCAKTSRQVRAVADSARSGSNLSKVSLRTQTAPLCPSAEPDPDGAKRQGPPDVELDDGAFTTDRSKAEGWLIEYVGGHDPTGARPNLDPSIDFGSRICSERRFLQIGTGQWCGAEYATLFPMRRTAVIYAREFGLLADRSALITPKQDLD